MMIALRRLNPAKILLGVLVVATSGFLVHKLQHIIADDAQMYAPEINVSGRQRELSQRTALLAQLLVSSRNTEDRSQLRRKLLENAELMARSHKGLIHGDTELELAGKLSPALNSLYYDPPHEVDISVRNYVATLRTLLQTPDAELAQHSSLLELVKNSALYDLPPSLHAVVGQYEQEGKLGMQQSRREIISLLVGVTLLGLITFLLLALYIINRKRSEKELRLSTQVINSSLEGIIVTDTKGDIQRVNPAFTTITGYTAEEVIGKNPRILQAGRHSPEFYKHMWSTIHTVGVWQGEIWKRCKDGMLVPTWQSIASINDDSGKIIHYTAVFSNISKQKKVEKELRHQSHHDALTRLPNRVLFLEYLDKCLALAKRKHTPIAVMLLDLDRFKVINDTLGHTVGDELLQAVAKRLKDCMRESDMVARLGGDEFTIVLPEIAKEEDAAHVGEKIIEAFGKPFWLADRELYVTTSIGISLCPSDGEDMDTLIKHADKAMYQAKEEGKNRFHMYTREMNARAHERLELETALRCALEREEFKVYYQPQVDIITGLITGAEALVRWQRPGQGLVSPVDFIPLAEETGLIVPIGEWVLNQACAQVKKWQDMGLPSFCIGVNLSARQLQQKDVADKVGQALRNTKLDPRFLDIEITESVAMNDAEAAISIMQAINEMGVYISVDDFGTGYSSLSYLKRLPIHTLKIDRSFIRDITCDKDDAIIVAAIINMARNLGLKIVAEGVETKEQLLLLREQKCDEAQGYLMKAPMPAHDFEQMLVLQKLPWLDDWPHASNQNSGDRQVALSVQPKLHLVNSQGGMPRD